MYIDMLYLQNDINILNNYTISMRKLGFRFVCFPDWNSSLAKTIHLASSAPNAKA